MLISRPDEVRNLGICAYIFAGGENNKDLGARGGVLRHRHQVVPPLKHGGVVVNVQDGDGDSGQRGQGLAGALVGGLHADAVGGLLFSVQWLLQDDDARRAVDGEEPIGRVGQGVHDLPVGACGRRESVSGEWRSRMLSTLEDCGFDDCLTATQRKTVTMETNGFGPTTTSVYNKYTTEPNGKETENIGKK